jgi:hypothetical protein
MLACACLLACPAGAFAQDPAAEIPDIAVSEPQQVTGGPSYGIARASSIPKLWATVNICDTKAAPDSMGVRASMPGNGTSQRMYMRFSAQYWSRARQDWAPVAGSGVSPWVYAGSARYERRQAGWTFSFASPPPGITFTMRAVVDFEWRADRRAGRVKWTRRGPRWWVARAVSRKTETGIAGVHGGDPAGTSKALCLIY